MRLIELRLKNLNSLKGEWHIDFSDEAFTDEGIFAITGQTGAGKTTILDAICLALYGETPRISNISKSTNEVMTRQTGDCYAEVVIDIDGVHYRCHWGQRRAHGKADGNLQDATHEISQANSKGSVEAGTILEHKASLTKKKIVELTRMDFQQFTRSILLAQGSFSAFLKAKADERADILEKITGTDIYATISQRTYDKVRDKQNKLSELEATLKGLALLEPEEEVQLKEQAQTHQQQLDKHRFEIDSLNKKIKWCEDVSELSEQLVQFQQDLAQSKQAQADFTAEAQRLDNANRALEIEGAYNQLQSKRQAYDSLSRQQQSLNEQLPVVQQQLTKDLAQLTDSQQLEQAASSKLNETLPIIVKTRELDSIIAQQQSICNQNRTQKTKLSTALSNLNHQLQQHTDDENKQQQQLQQLDQYLNDFSHHQNLAHDINSLDNLCVQLKDTLHDNHAAYTTRSNKLNQKQADQNKLQQLTKSRTDLETEVKNQQSQLTSLRQRQSALLQGHSLAGLRQQLDHNDKATALLQQLAQQLDDIEQLRTQLEDNKLTSAELKLKTSELQQQITATEAKLADLKQQRQDKQLNLQQQQKIFQLEAKLEDYIDLLEKNKPCPLCGSTQHPYLDDNNGSQHQRNSETEQQTLLIDITEQIAAVDSQIEQFDSQLNQQKITLATTEHDLNQKQNQFNTYIDQLSTKLSQCQQLTANLEQYINDNESSSTESFGVATQYPAISTIKTLLTEVTSFGTGSFDTDSFDKTDNNYLNQFKQAIHSTTEAIQSTIEVLNSQKLQIKKNIDDNDEVAENIQQVEKKIRDLDSKLQSIIIDINNTDTSLKYLEESIEQANIQITAHRQSITAAIEQLHKVIAAYKQNEPKETDACLQKASENLDQLQSYFDHDQALTDSQNESLLEPLRDLRRWMKDTNQTYNDKIQQKQQLSSKVNTLSVQITDKKAQIDSTEKEIEQLSETIESQSQQIEKLQQQRTELFGDKDVESETHQLRQALDKAKENLVQSREKHTATNYQLEQLTKNKAQTEDQLNSLHTELNQQQADFASLLQAQHFKNEQDFLQARLPRQERDQLSSQKQQIAQALQLAQNSVSTTETKLKEKQENPLTTEDKLVLKNQCVEKQKLADQLIEQLGAINQQLKTNEERKGEQQSQLAIIAQQKQDLKVWQQLNELIGSASGKKFRTFAQGLTFEIMIANANTQLQKMSDRYLLIRDEDSPLELNVIDNYQAGLQRSTKNLSGGEGFIISLALALGLSNMASHNIRVDSLFLDEGFGTLDEDSLDIALNTLTGLQQEGKLIGVISHVQALKERIHTQIKVEKLSGGNSQISGPGCQQL